MIRNDDAHSAAEETMVQSRSHSERRGRTGSEPGPSTAAQRYKCFMKKKALKLESQDAIPTGWICSENLLNSLMSSFFPL